MQQNTISDIANLEAIEAAAWIDIYRAQPPQSPHRVETCDGPKGVALFGLPGIPWTEFNRAQGFGLNTPLGARDLQAIMHWLQAYGASPWALQLPQPVLHPELLHLLQQAGLVSKDGFVAKLRHGGAAPKFVAGSVFKIVEVGADSAVEFGETVRVGFGGPAPLMDMFAALPGRPGWRTYVAYHNCLPAACGALFTLGRTGWVGVGATRPEWRDRGAQSALIQRRLVDGLAAGIEVFVAEAVAPALGGARAAISYGNLLRAGFEPSYLRRSFGPLTAT